MVQTLQFAEVLSFALYRFSCQPHFGRWVLATFCSQVGSLGMTDDVNPPISGVSPTDRSATKPDSAIISAPPGLQV